MLALALGPARAALSSEVDAPHLRMAARHGPLNWLGILVLSAAFLGLGFVLDQPDLRGEPFAAVLEAAYDEGAQRAEAASLQWLLGAANAVRTGVWYWAQIVGTELDSAAAWLFWLAFLLGVGVAAHALDEFQGRPLRTRISDRVLWALGGSALLVAMSLGVAGAARVSWWLLGFVAVGGFLVVAYNLEAFGGAFHSVAWFAFGWGAFPALVAYYAQTGTLTLPQLEVVELALADGRKGLETLTADDRASRMLLAAACMRSGWSRTWRFPRLNSRCRRAN